MEAEKGSYFQLLSRGNVLSRATIKEIKAQLESLGLQLKEVSPDLLNKGKYGQKLTKHLTRLDTFIVEGNPSWEGLAIGFPGSRDELSTKAVGTPYLRIILYPILDLHHRIQTHYEKRFPCVYFIGNRFSEVILRKFELIKKIIPHVITLTNDIYQCSMNKTLPPKTNKVDNESWTKMKICKKMATPDGLSIPTQNGDIKSRFLSYEVPCSEGTGNPERLDILGYADSNHSLIAFELKGPDCSRVELENLFLQAVEHRDWLEKNKMAMKLLFDRGPQGKRINTKKRARLLLGFYGNEIPHLFFELRKQAKRKNSYTKIDFVRITKDENDIYLRQFPNDIIY